MKRLGIITEGKTETAFVNKILRPYLINGNIDIAPRNMHGKVSVDRLRSFIKSLAYKFDMITMLVDHYGFKERGEKSITEIENEIKNAAPAAVRHKIIPYIQQYEFEALLFSDKMAVAKYLSFNENQKERLNKISQNPEEINHNMPPSKQLIKIYPKYNKVLDGVKIAEKIGLPAIMKKCPRFAGWVQKLENTEN